MAAAGDEQYACSLKIDESAFARQKRFPSVAISFDERGRNAHFAFRIDAIVAFQCDAEMAWLTSPNLVLSSRCRGFRPSCGDAVPANMLRSRRAIEFLESAPSTACRPYGHSSSQTNYVVKWHFTGIIL